MNLHSAIQFIFLSALLLISKPSFAEQNFCQNLEGYFDKSASEIREIISTKNNSQLSDLKDSTDKCAETFTAFKLQDGKDASKATAQETARRMQVALSDINDTKAQTDLSDFNFAAGLGVHYLLGKADIVSHTVDNGTLRITSEEKYKLGLWLSSNTFSTDFCTSVCLDSSNKLKKGLFVAVQMGGSNNSGILNSFAIGFALMGNHSKKQFKSSGTSPLVFQLGYGWTRIQSLANGYTNGMTMPVGVNQPVLVQTVEKGPVLLVSTAF